MGFEDHRKLNENERNLFEETRRSMLRIYHSNIQTHAGYLIAIVIGSFTLFSRWDIFFSSSITRIFFYLLITGLVFFTLLIVKRMLYWTSCSSAVICMTFSEATRLFEKGTDLETRSIKPYTRMIEIAATQHLKDLYNDEDTENENLFFSCNGKYNIATEIPEALSEFEKKKNSLITKFATMDYKSSMILFLLVSIELLIFLLFMEWYLFLR